MYIIQFDLDVVHIIQKIALKLLKYLFIIIYLICLLPEISLKFRPTFKPISGEFLKSLKYIFNYIFRRFICRNLTLRKMAAEV